MGVSEILKKYTIEIRISYSQLFKAKEEIGIPGKNQELIIINIIKNL